MIAIFKTGGKQYKVSVGDKIRVEKLEANEGDVLTFDEVLFLGDEEKVEIGSPFVSGVKVVGKVLSQGRNKKVWGIKYKAKKRFRMKFGHKQLCTEIQIEKIG